MNDGEADRGQKGSSRTDFCCLLVSVLSGLLPRSFKFLIRVKKWDNERGRRNGFMWECDSRQIGSECMSVMS